MGSSGDPNTMAIDPSVGGLVWVRRRNGSWWPGRIMGLDELSENCLVSPRSGTPVKLLGREDASVDWYNLERSKRVKPFRCGEYDECIEKAKTAAANSSKKAVKYARREDAIIHALELENARQSNCHPNFPSTIDKSDSDQNGVHELPTMSNHSGETEDMSKGSSSFEHNSNSAQELSHSGVSFEEPNQIGASMEHHVQGRRRRTPNDSEDDGTEGITRMRGLEDLGMGVESSLKRKRSQVGPAHEFLKRKNRRRPLTKVLESTAMVSVPITFECLVSPSGPDDKFSELETNESKKSLSMVVNNISDCTGVTCENGTSEHTFDASLIKQKESEISSMLGLLEYDPSDRLFDVPLVGDGKNSGGFSPLFVSCSSQKPWAGGGAQSSQSSQVETISPGNEEFYESGSTSSGAADTNNSNQRIEKGTSKWQSKGKRNSRHKTRSRKQDSRKSVDVSETEADEFRGWRWNSSNKEPHTCGPTPTPQRSMPYRQSRFTVNPKYQMTDISVRTYNAVPVLYDVNVQVKSSSRPHHVPYISLMSKLNSQPIVGHPLTIEVLEDGLCDHWVTGSERYLSSSGDELEDFDLQENMSALDSADTGYEVKPNPRGGRASKHLTFQPRVLPGKSPKSRKNGPSSKKTRKLSSLTSLNKRREEEKKPVVEKLKGPAIACVPLKVVFSRINASLNGSIRPVHRVSTS